MKLTYHRLSEVKSKSASLVSDRIERVVQTEFSEHIRKFSLDMYFLFLCVGIYERCQIYLPGSVLYSVRLLRFYRFFIKAQSHGFSV